MRKSIIVTIAALLISGAAQLSAQALKGDVNEDGNVDVADISTIIDIMAGELPKTRTFNVKGVTFSMVDVEGGTFRMGSDDSDAFDNEKPKHLVKVSSFSIGQTEVTQALWYAVMGQKPTSDGKQWSITYGRGNAYPAYYVSWNDCQEFITKLNELTGQTFRLPTEAEWEYAARGGNKSKGYKYSGSNTIGDVAWYWDNIPSQTEGDTGYGTQQVATKQANELGIYDMSGNVWEWCSDWYGSYSSNAQTDPTGPTSGSYRVDRGGSWSSFARYCRVANRDYITPSYRDSSLGLRLAALLISGAAQLSAQALKGDVNEDGNVDVADISTIIDIMAGELPKTRTFNVKGVTFSMVDVEGGTFQMGSNDSDAYSDEQPVHQVTVSSFCIGQTEVTQALWYAVMGQKPTSDGKQWSITYGRGNAYPAYYVSWDDCQEFISKLNELTGQKFRLPTEAEWEYAARGGNKSKGYKYSGSNTIDDVAWYRGNIPSQTEGDTGYGTQPVATKQANELGIYDMSGNVWEWCSDWYRSYSSNAQTDPTGPTSGSYRVFRGGGWGSAAGSCRVSRRGDGAPSDTGSALGLRLAL